MKRNKLLLSNICEWIYNGVVIPIMRYNFYCTEKHSEGSKVSYYRKPIWTMISKLALREFEEDNLEYVTPKERNELRNLNNYPVAKLRLVPKGSTFRPIMTFLRKAKANDGNKRFSLNQILQDTQIVLRRFKDIVGYDFGYAVFDNQQIFEKIDAFSKKWKSIGTPHLYFATMDIKKCYDSVDAKKLLEMLEKTEYLVSLFL